MGNSLEIMPGELEMERDDAFIGVQPTRKGQAARPEQHSTFWVHGIACGIVLLFAFLYMHHYMLRGWVSHDEGTLAQTAVRVLRGELPHRDFDDVYTGGLAMLNAVALRVFGMTLASIRTMLMIFAMVWTVAMYYCATRFVRPAAAAVTAALAVAWGPANYFSALPSWYNLFFATFGLAAVLRYTETRRTRWLFIAGVCGGISILFKITGLYFVVPIGLWLMTTNSEEQSSRKMQGGFALLALVTVATCGYELFLIRLAVERWRDFYLILFFAPAAFAGICGFKLYTRQFAKDVALVAISRHISAFVLGVITPIAAFLIPYFLHGGLSALIDGVFIEPAQRFVFAALPPVHMQFAVFSLAGVGVVLWLLYGRMSRHRKFAPVVAFVFTGGMIVGSALNSIVYRILWVAVYLSVPLLVVLAAQHAVSRNVRHDRAWRAKLLLLSLLTAMCALVQFPFSAPIYFCYVAPLAVLLAAALLPKEPFSLRLRSGLLASAVLIYSIWQVGPLFIYNLGWQNEPYQANYVMRNPRAGGIRIPSPEGEAYDRTAELVREHARGEYIFATPDCPEIYFLTGHRNPTRTMYDFFDRGRNRTARIAMLLDRDHINLVVLNSQPEFSNPISAEMTTNLLRDYPDHEVVGKFDVRWRP